MFWWFEILSDFFFWWKLWNFGGNNFGGN
jgi:hypothetical protein